MDSAEKAKKPVLKIIGKNGNAFNLLGLAKEVALKNGMDWPTIQGEAMSGDYNHLLNILRTYFDVR